MRYKVYICVDSGVGFKDYGVVVNGIRNNNGRFIPTLVEETDKKILESIFRDSIKFEPVTEP